MNFPSENSTIISAHARSAQTYEALPVSMIRRAGLIQKLRSFSCNAIFQFFNVTGSVHLTGSITILLRRSAYPYVHQLCSIFAITIVTEKYTFLYYRYALHASFHDMLNILLSLKLLPYEKLRAYKVFKACYAGLVVAFTVM